MTTSKNGVELIKSFEGCRLTAYQDSAKIWTIGYGSILYPTGSPVKKGDRITQEVADKMLLREVRLKEMGVNNLIGNIALNQNQFDALVSFAFNVGIGALAGSTLLRKVKKDSNDMNIRDEFMKWNKVTLFGKLKPLQGLTNRRQIEANLYFTA